MSLVLMLRDYFEMTKLRGTMMLKSIAATLLLLLSLSSSALLAETLDEAIKRFVSTATDTIADVAPIDEALVQAKAAVKAAQSIAPSDELDNIAELLDTLIAGEPVSEEERLALMGQLAAFANANSAVYHSLEQHEVVNRVIHKTMKTLPAKMELIAVPTQVSKGEYSTLMWISTHENCQIGTQAVDASGSMWVGPLDSTREFNLSCINELAQKSEEVVSIKVIESVSRVVLDTKEPFETNGIVVSESSIKNQSNDQQASNPGEEVNYPVGILPVASATVSGFLNLDGVAYTASNAIDGDLSTHWMRSGISVEAEESEWIILDLGEERKLNTLRIAFNKYDAGRIYDYDIAVSKDNENWKTVIKSAQSATTEWTTQTFDAEIAQYVKITLNAASDNSRWVNLREIELLNREVVNEVAEKLGVLNAGEVLEDEALLQAKAAVKSAQEELNKIAELLEALTVDESLSEGERQALIHQLSSFTRANSAVCRSIEQHSAVVVDTPIEALLPQNQEKSVVEVIEPVPESPKVEAELVEVVKVPSVVVPVVNVLPIVSATASAPDSTAFVENAMNAIDGDMSTRWTQSGISHKAEEFEWITLDLGEERALNTVRIAFFKYDRGRIYNYDIAVSKDTKNWKTVAKHTKSSVSQWTSKSFKTESARYVKVTINSASDFTVWANLFEIEVLNIEGMAPPKKVTLKWNASEGDVDGYKVYFGTTKENTGKTRLAIVRTNSVEFDKTAPSVTFGSMSDLGLSEDDPLCFSLRAFNSAGQSDMSETICGKL